jgi:hypothetical protein
MADWKEEPRKGRQLAITTVIVGVLLICIPLLLEDLVLAQPQCSQVAHPGVFLFIRKCFDLVNKIGDACLIAGLLGIVVDRGLKTQFIQEVVRSASPKLIGQHLPDPIREALFNYFQIRLIRPDWDIEYELTQVENSQDYLKVTSRIQGIVHNCGWEPEEFAFRSSIDPSPRVAPGDAEITRVSARPESGSGGFDEFPPDNAKLLQPDGTKLFERTVFIPPGGRYKTVFESVEYRPTSAIMPLFSGTTVVKATIRIRYPRELLEIQVSTGTSMNFQPESTL